MINQYNKTGNQNVIKIVSHPAASKSLTQSKRIALKQADGIHLVRFNEIMYVKSDANYIHVYLLDGKRFMLCRTLKSFIESLPAHQFILVHQSYLVSINLISKINLNNKSSITLENGTEIGVSRTGKKRLSELLESM